MVGGGGRGEEDGGEGGGRGLIYKGMVPTHFLWAATRATARGEQQGPASTTMMMMEGDAHHLQFQCPQQI